MDSITIWHKVLQAGKKYAPQIMGGTACGLTIASSILSGIAGYKSSELVHQQYKEPKSKREIAKLTWKNYIPAGLCCVGSVALTAGSLVLSTRTQRSLIAACLALQAANKEYAESGMSWEEFTQERMKEQLQTVPFPQDPNLKLFYLDTGAYDWLGETYFESTMEEVLSAEYRLNRKYAFIGWQTVNDLRHLLDLEPVDGGDAIGWSMETQDGLFRCQWIEFEHEDVQIDEDLVCTVIHVTSAPSTEFMADWI